MGAQWRGVLCPSSESLPVVILQSAAWGLLLSLCLMHPDETQRRQHSRGTVGWPFRSPLSQACLHSSLWPVGLPFGVKKDNVDWSGKERDEQLLVPSGN